MFQIKNGEIMTSMNNIIMNFNKYSICSRSSISLEIKVKLSNHKPVMRNIEYKDKE